MKLGEKKFQFQLCKWAAISVVQSLDFFASSSALFPNGSDLEISYYINSNVPFVKIFI